MRKFRPEVPHRLLVERLEIGRVDAVRDHGDALLLDPVDVGDVVAHVGGAGDHLVGAVRHPVLDPVDMALRMLVDPALMAPVLRRVNRRHERRAKALREMVARHRDEPVVPVHEIEVEAIAELDAGREHVRVHVLDPSDEFPQLHRPKRLANAVKMDAFDDLFGGRLFPSAGQHVDLDVERRQILRELAHVAGQAPLDQRRVLPGEHQHLDGHG